MIYYDVIAYICSGASERSSQSILYHPFVMSQRAHPGVCPVLWHRLVFFLIFYQSPGRSNKALFLVGNKQFAVYSRESRDKNRNKKYIFSVLIYPRFFHVAGYSLQNNHETHLAVRAAPCQRGVSVPRLLGLSVEWLSSIIWPLTGGMSFTPSSTCWEKVSHRCEISAKRHSEGIPGGPEPRRMRLIDLCTKLSEFFLMSPTAALHTCPSSPFITVSQVSVLWKREDEGKKKEKKNLSWCSLSALAAESGSESLCVNSQLMSEKQVRVIISVGHRFGI